MGEGRGGSEEGRAEASFTSGHQVLETWLLPQALAEQDGQPDNQGPRLAAAVDSWVGCTLNKGIQPESQMGAEIQLTFPLQSHVLCGLVGSRHSPALQALTEPSSRVT